MAAIVLHVMAASTDGSFMVFPTGNKTPKLKQEGPQTSFLFLNTRIAYGCCCKCFTQCLRPTRAVPCLCSPLSLVFALSYRSCALVSGWSLPTTCRAPGHDTRTPHGMTTRSRTMSWACVMVAEGTACGSSEPPVWAECCRFCC